MGKETKKMLEIIISYQEMIMKHLKIGVSEMNGHKVEIESKKTKSAPKGKVRKMVRR